MAKAGRQSIPGLRAASHGGQSPGTGRRLQAKKRHYIMLVSRDDDGTLNRVSIPLHYAYGFVAVAIVGLFTITGLAGSYTRMLVKTERFNQLRQDHNRLQSDYAHLEKTAHDREVQAASLGSLASEISALYGMTASRLAIPLVHVGRHGKAVSASSAGPVATTPLTSEANSFSNASYYKSLDTFYALRTSALSGGATRFLPSAETPLGITADATLTRVPSLDSALGPNLWPVLGPITSGFGQREDPVLGTGEGEFHKGVDIGAPLGTPIHATADGTVLTAGLGSGYGREVVIDHGRGVKTLYGHMSGFNVIEGQTVFRGEIIGYVGHSGRTTGNHVHYEVRIRDIAVNPHKYLQNTLGNLGGNVLEAKK